MKRQNEAASPIKLKEFLLCCCCCWVKKKNKEKRVKVTELFWLTRTFNRIAEGSEAIGDYRLTHQREIPTKSSNDSSNQRAC